MSMLTIRMVADIYHANICFAALMTATVDGSANSFVRGGALNYSALYFPLKTLLQEKPKGHQMHSVECMN